MQSKIQNVNISYWFQKLEYNPKDKIKELSDEIKSIIDTPLLFNDEMADRLISMPRIEGISADKKSTFAISLINASLFIDVNDMDNDDVILLINERVQLIFDVLKDIYNIDIIYTSIKLQMVNDNHIDYLKNKLKLTNSNYEDLSIKRGLIKDDYYINYVISASKEYSFNITKKNNELEQDMFDKTLLIPLSEAKLNKEYTSIIIEINDRYSYNINPNYHTEKSVIRGMILELKDILKNELYNEI